MNLRQRCQAVFQAGYEWGKTSFRRLAKKTKLSKSSAHRLYHRIARRNQHPESSLWETEAGQDWLRLLVLATIFVFALQGGIGCERLSQFFHLLRLQRHIGVSPTALRSLRSQIELKIIDYQRQQEQQLRTSSSQVEVCAAADETFFDQVILVMLDLPSGYIFVEEITEDCQFETWQEKVTQVFKPLGLTVKYLVSDRAKAIVKLALKDLGTTSIADLFHVLYNLNRSLALELNCLGAKLQKQLKMQTEKRAEPELIAQIETNQRLLQQSRLTYDNCCHRLSTCLHPFALNENRPQTTETVAMELQSILHTLQTLRQTHQLKDSRNSLRAMKNQIESLSAIVDLWWSWVDQCLAACGCEINLVHWVKDYLLPAAYWQQQVQRTKNPDLRGDYQAASWKTQEFLRIHPMTMSLSSLEREQWQHWAIWMVSKFQRCSSAVEGRNGYLSQVHHNRRGLSSNRLKVSTVIHNFALKRTDGTTAAERLFGRKFPDLFEYLENNRTLAKVFYGILKDLLVY
ncbi:DUF6399 domain-containing protein [Pleurocapsa sp. PCC 7319]|uniref:DUF6399 domain-containing protein n=1 Tax=Pleurocapsa sp. PCC 7319 TaxID=118161 RepID=UPI0003449A65|nr:DUF6399 domain-containing protein [Pleurocapsa sp. PCC 7319]